MDNNPELKEIYNRYLNKTASVQEIGFLLDYFGRVTEPELRQLIRTELSVKEPSPDQAGLENKVEQLYQDIVKHIRNQQHVQPVPLKKGSKWYWFAAAAAALVLSFSVYWFAGFNPGGIKTVHAGWGETKQIPLPDGSTVWLNAGTKVSYPDGFTAKTRTVRLIEGEAFFNVKPDTQRPFIVTAGQLALHVLGTSFNVSNYADEGEEIVSVATGKVAVRTSLAGKKGTEPVVLASDDQLLLNRLTGKVSQRKVDGEAAALWRSDQFLFDNKPLGAVFKVLERRFNKKILVRDSALLPVPVSGKINKQSISTVLELLSFTKNFKYENINDSTIIIQ